jgi:peptidyl-prolyl cis-trans isomerase A (cyclophilin A)
MRVTKIRSLMTILAALCVCGPGAQTKQSAADPLASLPDGLYAAITTPKGVIVFELFHDKAPVAVTSFVGLAEGTLSPGGRLYFDGIVFHRVEPGFVIQGGDPTGTGRGGPGYQFPNEIDPTLGFGSAGVVGMANAGPDTNGSQFFITLGPAEFLDGSYTVFGRVVSGASVAAAIRKGDAMTSVRILRKGSAARSFQADKAAFDAAVAANPAKAAERARKALEAQYAAIEARIPGLSTDARGLRSKILRQGNGTKPVKGASVRILYTLTLAKGKKIDSTTDRKDEPFAFTLGAGKVVAGFDAAVSVMSYGERRIVVIPPELGYGAKGAGSAVPGNSVLVFELELLAP